MLNWRKIFQLVMVHVGVSITVVPVTGTLNRVMIADLGLSAFLVGFLIALPYLLSPVQVAIGHWADSRSLWGRFRSPWIVIGGLLAAFGSYFTAHAAFLFQTSFGLGLITALFTFTVWGLGVNMASVSYLSLISEMAGEAEQWRSQAVSSMWTVMIIATILISLTLSQMLEPFSQEALFSAFGLVWAISFMLVLFGSANLEGKELAEARLTGTLPKATDTSNNPVLAYRVLLQNPSARRFFVYLLLVLVSIHAQDVLLEPFGGQVLGMEVAQTTRLSAIWGVGVLITLLGGIEVIRRIGKKACANWGAAIAALAFLFVIMVGLVHASPVAVASFNIVMIFQSAVFLLGLGGGLMTVSNLSYMLEMTIPQAAGLYMGAWGVANFTGQALGNILSGFIRDSVFRLSGNIPAGYMIVFGLEMIGLIAAILLFRHISVGQFREDAQLQLKQTLALAGSEVPKF